MDESGALREEARRLQTSGVLGEAKLRRLFDYLVDCSLAGQSPKEIAIAVDVFGKGAEFDVSQDSLVRVYIHKLRRTLDEFYAAAGDAGPGVLQIPRGEYRLRLSPRAPLAAERPVIAGGWMRRGLRRDAVMASAALGAAFLLGWGLSWLRTPRSELDLVRANPVWSAILKDDRPILVLVGDYYLIGETGQVGETGNGLELKRLVREFSVNSKSDLNDYVQQHPEYATRYMDVGLRYLPPAAAFALRNVMAVLAPANRRITVSLLSDLQPSSLVSADIIYVGYLSGLGMMQDLVFNGSRFHVGDSFDEIIDQPTHHTYTSQTGDQFFSPPQPSGSETAYHDYGIFAKLRGPGGNTVLVIAGTRDAGVRQTAEAFTSPDKIEEFARAPLSTGSFETLLDVSAYDGVNLSGKLLLQSRRDAGAAKF
jgi:hypothetical protein